MQVHGAKIKEMKENAVLKGNTIWFKTIIRDKNVIYWKNESEDTILMNDTVEKFREQLLIKF